MRKATIAVLILGAAALSGCAQTGTFTAGNLTTVELSEPNYEVVATGVSGTAKAGYLIGASFSDGAKSGSISLFRVSGTGHLYKEAMDGLWASFESEHGAVAGRRLALVNIRYDADTRNFLVYGSLLRPEEKQHVHHIGSRRRARQRSASDHPLLARRPGTAGFPSGKTVTT